MRSRFHMGYKPVVGTARQRERLEKAPMRTPPLVPAAAGLQRGVDNSDEAGPDEGFGCTSGVNRGRQSRQTFI